MLQLRIFLFIFSIFTVTRAIDSYTPPHASTIRHSLEEADPKLSSEVDDLIIDTLADGLSAGVQITDALTKGFEMLDSKKAGFIKVAAIAGKAYLVFGALESFVSLKDMFVKPEEDQKLDQIIQLLTEGFKQIEKRFDSLASKLSDIEKIIKIEHIWPRLSPVLHGLDIVNQLVHKYYQSQILVRKEDLINRWDGAYEHFIVLRNEFTEYGLCDTMTDLTNVNRRKVMNVALDLYGRLIRGASNVFLIAKLRNRIDLSQIKKDMDDWLDQVSTSIDDCDKQITTRRWQRQWRVDLHKVDDQGRANDYAQNIFRKLSKKYYWRIWFVVVYDVMKGKKNHFVQTCSTTGTQFTKNRFRVIVSSSSGSETKEMYSQYEEIKKKMIELKLPKSNHAYKIYKKLPMSYRFPPGDCVVQIRGVVRKYGRKDFIIIKGAGELYTRTHDVKKRHWFRRRTHTFRVFIMGGV